MRTYKHSTPLTHKIIKIRLPNRIKNRGSIIKISIINLNIKITRRIIIIILLTITIIKIISRLTQIYTIQNLCPLTKIKIVKLMNLNEIHKMLQSMLLLNLFSSLKNSSKNKGRGN